VDASWFAADLSRGAGRSGEARVACESSDPARPADVAAREAEARQAHLHAAAPAPQGRERVRAATSWRPSARRPGSRSPASPTGAGGCGSSRP